MERDLENANPTILSVSQLPSRNRKGAAARQGPDSKCDKVVYPKHHWPYGASSSSDEDEEYGEEPVDAQDVYGKCRRLGPRSLALALVKPSGSHNTWGHGAATLPGAFFLAHV